MSYTKCVYHGCDNTSQDISMFRFPVHDQGRLLLWILNSGNIYLDSLTNEELRRRYICAAHFPKSSIHKGNERSRLIGSAVPVHFKSTEVREGTSTQTNSHANMETDVPSSPEFLKVKTPVKFYSKRPTSASGEILSTAPSPSLFQEYTIVGTPTQRLSRKCQFEGSKRRLSRKCLFEENINDTPKTMRLKRSASGLLRKNRAQSAQILRLRKKSKKQLKATMAKENFRSEVSKTLALMQLRMVNDKKKWTTEEKNFCLSLFYKSPATYYFLKRQGVVLAAPSTIRMWLAKSNYLPGLCPDTCKNIKKRFENADIEQKACVICFDEMSIMTQLDYSKKYDFIEGFEDLGGGHRSNKIAKYALVFVVRGLYSKWKLPVAYFLSNSNVKANTLQLLVNAVINKLFDSGLLPKAVVCDQATTNQKVYKSFGVTTKSPFFFTKDRKIFAFFDVPHLIKNIRNNFITNNFINGKNELSFQDVVKTYEIDKKSECSRSLTKLKDCHMNPNSFQKMSVRLATQIFSNSVAAAVKTCSKTGQLRSETADATADFILLVNNMFDALNSRRQFDENPNRHSLSRKSIYVRQAIVNGKNLFENLYKISYKNNKLGQCEKIMTRPPCFDGVVQSCEAVLQLFHEESTDSPMRFLITQKLNQDVIENLFARFRQKGGSNRNPSAKLIRMIFRSCFLNSLIKLPNSTNCQEEDDDEYIELNVGQTTEHSTNSTDCQEEDKEYIELNVGQTIEHNTNASSSNSATTMQTKYDEEISSGVTLEECSITYFAGYLAKSCLSKNKCNECHQNLLKEVDLEDKKQLLILNKSYNFNKSIKLKMPSDCLVNLVTLSLDCYNRQIGDIIHCNNIKSQLFKAIVDFLRCEAQELLDISCQEHLYFIIDLMISVKIHFYCKSRKTNVSVHPPKLRILKNM